MNNFDKAFICFKWFFIPTKICPSTECIFSKPTTMKFFKAANLPSSSFKTNANPFGKNKFIITAVSKHVDQNECFTLSNSCVYLKGQFTKKDSGVWILSSAEGQSPSRYLCDMFNLMWFALFRSVCEQFDMRDTSFVFAPKIYFNDATNFTVGYLGEFFSNELIENLTSIGAKVVVNGKGFIKFDISEVKSLDLPDFDVFNTVLYVAQSVILTKLVCLYNELDGKDNNALELDDFKNIFTQVMTKTLKEKYFVIVKQYLYNDKFGFLSTKFVKACSDNYLMVCAEMCPGFEALLDANTRDGLTKQYIKNKEALGEVFQDYVISCLNTMSSL